MCLLHVPEAEIGKGFVKSLVLKGKVGEILLSPVPVACFRSRVFQTVSVGPDAEGRGRGDLTETCARCPSSHCAGLRSQGAQLCCHAGPAQWMVGHC